MVSKVLCCLAFSAAACNSFPQPLVPGGSSGDGYLGCRQISVRARDRASADSALGWTFSITGASAVAAGTTVIPLDGSLTRSEKIVAGSLAVAGALLVTVGQAWFKRSDAASTLAGEAAAILGNSDAEGASRESGVVQKCNIALGAWERSRTDASELSTHLLQDEKKEAEVAKAKNASSE